MVLALVSFLLGWTFLVPLAALILGIIGLRREPAGKAMALTGVIVSGIILLAWVLIIVAALFFGLFAIGAATTSVPNAL